VRHGAAIGTKKDYGSVTPHAKKDMAMTLPNKASLSQEKSHPLQPAHGFYDKNGPVNAIIGDVDDDVMSARDDHGRFVAHLDSDRTERFTNRVTDGVSRVAKSAQKTAKRTATQVQNGAKTTAQAVREHPVMTVAVLGGLATAAYAGVRIYKARADANGRAETRASSKQKTIVARPVANKKH
jgi:ElaB/YqjD/DUF883 family membrane-anchored ribosome-binding protein